METSHQPPQGEEEIIRVSRAHAGWVLREEEGAGFWVWVTPPATEPLLAGVLGGQNVYAGVVNNPMSPVTSYSA